MLNQSFLDAINDRCRAGETGRLVLHANEDSGFVDVHEGVIMHASYQEHEGILAFFNLLKAEALTLEWKENFAPDVPASVNKPLDELMWNLVQGIRGEGDGGGATETGITDMAIAEATPAVEEPAEASFVLDEQEPAPEAESEQPAAAPAYISNNLLLRCLNPELNGLVFELKRGNYLLGKARECDCVLSHPTISKYECTVTVYDDHVEVVDRGSALGIRYNGIKLPEFYLLPGDHLMLGGVEFTVEMVPISEAPEAAATPVAGVTGKKASKAVREVITGPIKIEHILPQTKQAGKSLLGRLFQKA